MSKVGYHPDSPKKWSDWGTIFTDSRMLRKIRLIEILIGKSVDCKNCVYHNSFVPFVNNSSEWGCSKTRIYIIEMMEGDFKIVDKEDSIPWQTTRMFCYNYKYNKDA